MKNKILIALIIGLATLSACKKTILPDGGSWIFRSQTYHATFTNNVNHSLVSYTGPNFPTGALSFTWNHMVIKIDTDYRYSPPHYVHDTTYPHDLDSIYPRSGTYHATNVLEAKDSTLVYVTITDTSALNVYKPSGFSSALVTVNRSANMLTVSIGNVMMIADNKDSALLSSGNVKLTPPK